MKKKLFLYTVALTAGLFSACSSDDDQETPIRHISVEVNQRSMVSGDDESEARSMTTRADIITTATFEEFYMCGVYGGSAKDYTASKSDKKWTVTPDIWPDYDNSVSFYAFTVDNDKFVNGAKPYVSFTMTEDAFQQHDLLVAKNTVSYNDHQGKVPLTFDHACAAVAFNVQITNTLKTNKLGNGTLTVNSIVLRNVSNTGKYYFGETPAWGDVSGSAYYTLTDGNITVDTELQALRSNYLFVIPQSRDANGTTGTYLEINYTFTGQKQTSATIPLAVNWAAGRQYTINIKLGTTLIK